MHQCPGQPTLSPVVTSTWWGLDPLPAYSITHPGMGGGAETSLSMLSPFSLGGRPAAGQEGSPGEQKGSERDKQRTRAWYKGFGENTWVGVCGKRWCKRNRAEETRSRTGEVNPGARQGEWAGSPISQRTVTWQCGPRAWGVPGRGEGEMLALPRSPVLSLLGQEERPCADIDVLVGAGQAPAVLLQVVPGVLVEVGHLVERGAQSEGLP